MLQGGHEKVCRWQAEAFWQSRADLQAGLNMAGKGDWLGFYCGWRVGLG